MTCARSGTVAGALGLVVITGACTPQGSDPCPPGTIVREGRLDTDPATKASIRFRIYRTDLGNLFICFPEADGRVQELTGSELISVSAGRRDGVDALDVLTRTDAGLRVRDTFDRQGELLGSEQLPAGPS